MGTADHARICPADHDAARPAMWVVSYGERQPYREMWELQRRLRAHRLAGEIPDVLLLLEHEPVVTLGRNARKANLLLSEALFRERGVDVVEVDRGGDVTWHGPGQLVGYWIFDLKALYQDVHRYLREIEEVLIRTLARCGIAAGRSRGATGVWVPGDRAADPRTADRCASEIAPPSEKIAAMGLHLSHWVSIHGFALNIDPDLAAFSWIVPCGLEGRGVTSMRKVLRAPVSRDEVESGAVAEAAAIFGRRPVRVSPDALLDALAAKRATPRDADHDQRSDLCRV